ncbi:MAG TPA: peptidase M20 [Gammaproteobacteria bacterium]|nr:M20/M25/M40 family metallo-hydrolase [Pseudomonadota bacterium]HAY46699.1 peptidase M20 [Gammaproteobacteria bacterium]
MQSITSLSRTHRSTVCGLFAVLCFSVAGVGAQDRYPLDWEDVERESLEHFFTLLRTNTSNPPGNETVAATYLEQVLENEGIEADLFARDPDRANMVARIKGNGSKEPLLVMAHTDVVGVQPENWSVDPFGAVQKDGYIYGRGALDDKDNVTASLMLMLLLQRSGVELDRDVIFLAEAGEEGTTAYGIDYMVENHWDKIGAEYCLAEGGGTVSQGGVVQRVGITTTEKFPMRVTLVARGTAGHGSRPRVDNAIAALAGAVSRLANWQSPLRLNETTRAYFERLAEISEPEDAERYRSILDPEHQPRVERYFAEHEPQHYSLLRTSVAPTIITGGFRRNVIPSEASATFDIRGLPDENPEDFYVDLAGIINNPDIEIVPEGVYRPASPPSGLNTPVFQALENVAARLYPSAITIPTMLTGATDMAQVRAKGTQCYGFGPIIAAEDSSGGGGSHGDDERILEDSVLSLVQFLWYTVIEIAATAK